MLYIVSTPIGNLEDITLRALRILKEVSVVLCEDTRVTKKLLSHYDIHTKTMSYHAHSTDAIHERIIEMLKSGTDCALVTDAGTPAVSDPGGVLVERVRCCAPEIPIVIVPGPSALTSALALSGVPVQDFIFLGFLPHKKGRETLFKEIQQTERAVVFYESSHRILKALVSLEKYVEDRYIVVTRELTKIFEEVLHGTAHDIAEILEKYPEKQRGEFVVIVAPLGYNTLRTRV